MDLTRVVPVAVPVALAGATWLVPPLTLGELAQLQGWLKHVAGPSPVAAHRRAIAAAPEGPARDLAAARAYLALEAWPIRFGTREAARHFAGARGAAFFLAVCLDRATGPAQGRPAAGDLTPSEWAELSAAAFGADPLLDLIAILEPAAAGAEAEAPMNWGEAFAEVAAETGWTFDEIAGLTVGQFLAYRTRGALPGGSVAPRPGETIGQAAARRAALFALAAQPEGETP